MLYKSKERFIQHLKKLSVYKILGVDYGTKKIGTAIYDNQSNFVLPLAVVIKDGGLKSLLAVIKSNKINGIVIGLPLGVDGAFTKACVHVAEFAKDLSGATRLPCILSDERFTTLAANELLKNADIKRKKRNQIDDMIAAKILLEDFLGV